MNQTIETQVRGPEPWGNGWHIQFTRIPSAATVVHDVHTFDLNRVKNALKKKEIIPTSALRASIIATSRKLIYTASETGGNPKRHRKALRHLIKEYFPNDPLSDDEI